MKEIKIQGAGVSGLTAAINLAKSGRRVRVYEKNPECGMRFSGDLEGIENWTCEKDALVSLEEMNIEIDFFCTPLNKAELLSPSFEKAIAVSEEPFFYYVRRGPFEDCLDMGLKHQALKAGASIEFNSPLKDEEADIIASGPKKADSVMKGVNFYTSSGERALIILDDELAPKGYTYLFTAGGFGTMGVVLFERYEKTNLCFEKARGKIKRIIDVNMEQERPFGGYANFFKKRSYKEKDKLILGEAAGLQDYLLGGGLRQAITSGYLASRNITEGEDFDALMKRNLTKQLEVSRKNRFFYNVLGNKGYDFIVRRTKGRDVREALKKAYTNSGFLNGLGFLK